MNFEIVGSHRETGRQERVFLKARNSQDAQQQAEAMDINWTAINELPRRWTPGDIALRTALVVSLLALAAMIPVSISMWMNQNVARSQETEAQRLSDAGLPEDELAPKPIGKPKPAVHAAATAPASTAAASRPASTSATVTETTVIQPR